MITSLEILDKAATIPSYSTTDKVLSAPRSPWQTFCSAKKVFVKDKLRMASASLVQESARNHGLW
jgi:hypothetical protein